MFKNLALGTKIIAGYLIVITFVGITALVGYGGIKTVAASLFQVGNEEAPLVDMANEMKLSLMVARNTMEEFKGATAALATDDAEVLETVEAAYQQALADFDTFADAILEGATLEGGTVVLKTDNEELASLVRQSDEVHNNKFQVAAQDMMKQGKELLARKAERNAAMEALGQLAGGVAHDFNNLLQVIQGYGEMAMDNLPADASARTQLAEVMKAGDRATTLVRQLLIFSRSDTMEAVNLDINSTIEDLIKMLLPVDNETQESKAEVVSEDDAHLTGTGTVLLAEDDEYVRDMATRVLKKAGYTVVAVHDGLEATDVFEQNRDTIDIAVLDVIMPKKSGRAVHDGIRAIRPDLPILLCSGYSFDVLEQGALPEEAHELIRKPYDLADFLHKVQELLAKDSTRVA